MKTRNREAQEKREAAVAAEAKVIEEQLAPQLLGMIEQFKAAYPGQDGYMYIDGRNIAMKPTKPEQEGSIIHVFKHSS